MNKKITSSALAALLVAGSTSFTAFAAMGNGTVVIGNKAFDLGYANATANLAEITNAIVAGGAVYVKGFDGQWIDNATSKVVDASVIPAVTYKNLAGVETKFDAKDMDAAPVVTEVKVASVTAVTAKKVEVKFNAPVDTTKAVFAVKRDAIKVNTSTVVWNDAKTVATIELASKISKADYTVEVSGLTTAVLTGTFAGTDEKVSKIQILSTDVSLIDSARPDDAGDTLNEVDDLAVAYKVYNQYNEDITKVTSLIATSNGTYTEVFANKGIIEITGNFDQYISNKAAITIIHAETGVSATATLNVVAQAKVGEVKIVGIYNKDGKTLTESTNLLTDKFYLEITAKDQFGNEIDPSDAANIESILVSESNNTKIDLADSTVNGTTNVPTVLDTVVDGRYFIQLNGVASTNFAKSGESTITFISRVTGKSNAFTVKVAEGARANTVTISQPELVAVGEEALLPLSVFDKEGNQIKDLTLLNDSVRGITVAGGAVTNSNIVLKDGETFIKVPASENSSETIKTVVVTINATYKVTSVNYTIKARALPKVIVGVSSDINTSVSGLVKQSITAEDIVIEDQYGRQMSTSAKNAWINVTGNSIRVESTVAPTSTFEVKTNSGIALAADSADAATQTITNSTEKFVLVPTAPATGVVIASSEKLTFTLVQNAVPSPVVVSSSAKDVVFSKSEIAEYSSYRISTKSTISNGVTPFSFKVYGVKADATEILLDASKYHLALPSEFILAALPVDGAHSVRLSSALATSGVGAVIDADANNTVPLSKDFTFTVTIGNDAATKVTKVVKVSAEASDVAKIGFTEDGVWNSDEFDGANFVVAGTVLDRVDLAKYAFTDNQYGSHSSNYALFESITFSKLIKTTNSSAVIDVATNGSALAHVDNLQAGDRVTVTVGKNGISKTLEITVANVDLVAPTVSNIRVSSSALTINPVGNIITLPNAAITSAASTLNENVTVTVTLADGITKLAENVAVNTTDLFSVFSTDQSVTQPTVYLLDGATVTLTDAAGNVTSYVMDTH